MSRSRWAVFAIGILGGALLMWGALRVPLNRICCGVSPAAAMLCISR